MEWLVPCALALGLLIRARILGAAPLTPPDPVRWLLAGLNGDLLVTLAIALATAAIFILLPHAGAVVAALAVTAMLAAQFALSEAAIALGHGLRGEDLETGLHPLLLTGSASGGLLAAALTVIAACVAAALFAWRMARRGARSPLTLSRLTALAVVVFVAALLFPSDDADAARNAFVAAPSLLRYAAVDQPAPVIRAPAIDVRLARELVANAAQATFISDDYPLAHLPPPRSPLAITTQPSPPLNVVIILLESVRAEEVGVYGNDPPGVTPNLDQLARDGIRVDRAYSPGAFTPEGELSVLYGALASPGEIVIRARPSVRLAGFPEILSRAGWRSFLRVTGSDDTLYLGNRFYHLHGIPVIDGREFPNDPQTSWGVGDRALMRHGIELLDHLQPPFVTLLGTTTNHHPFQLPSDSLSQISGVRSSIGQFLAHNTYPMLQTVHYTDQAVGDFFRAARARPWFRDTIFVFCGDHGTTVTPVNRKMTRHTVCELRHRIPMILYSPRLPHGVVVPGPASQADILPTFLALAGVRTAVPGTGHDLLDPAQRDGTRPVISFESVSNTISIHRGRFAYHAVAAPGTRQLGDELLVDDVADPDGRVNLMTRERDVARACRRAATIYFQTYGWIVARNRAGLP